jgi:predicted HAD superfamily phosphohydrolase
MLDPAVFAYQGYAAIGLISPALFFAGIDQAQGKRVAELGKLSPGARDALAT